nr:SpoIIE family protein phosphatase [uncultured Ruminococcus sp.]
MKKKQTDTTKPEQKTKEKRFHTLFAQIGLLMLLIILILDGAVLMLTYKISYENNLKIFEDQLRGAAKATVHYCETYNIYDDEVNAEKIDPLFDDISDLFNVTYVYVIEPDIETRSETYLEISFGDEASEDAKRTRFRGVTVSGKLNDSQIEAYNGNTGGVILHEVTTFDDALICYMPCTRYFDTEKDEYVNYKKPLIVASEISIQRVNARFEKQFLQIAILTLTVTLVIAGAFALLLYFKVTKPVRVINKRMSRFVTDRKKNTNKLDERGSSEFEQMSHSFNTMSDEINSYIDYIKELHRVRHMQEAELDIAREIQKGLLKPEHSEIATAEIRGYMDPARDVGGDLYDYCQLDDGKTFVAIADVSGKGISASLFMSRAITLLHLYAQMDYTPARILEEYNNTLASQNPNGMFITTFIAIWDPVRGEMIYSNAGHNIPYVLSDRLIPLDQSHGVAAGLFEGEKYEDALITLKEGDTLFLFTDGVNEAKNAGGAFYSTERLEEKLTGCIKTQSPDTLTAILNDLRDFTQGAVQNDDITMLTMKIKNPPKETVLRLKSNIEQLPSVKQTIFALPLGEDLKRTIYLAAEEIFVNICSYAYETIGDVVIKLCQEQDKITLTFIDGGKPFDPTKDVLEIDDYDHEHAIGGLGRYLAFSIAESYHYEYTDEKNILSLTFSKEVQDDDQKNA